LWIFLQTFETDRRKIAIYFRIPQARLPRLCVQQQLDSLVRRSTRERWMTGEQLVKHSAKSIDIRCCGDCRVVSHRLLRRHVTRRAQYFQGACYCALRFDKSRQTEIRQMRLAVLIEQNVPWFDVSMKNAVLVCVMNRPRYLRD